MTGTLTLNGSSSVANYKTALDSVTYFNSSDNPSGADRTVSYTVNDGTLDSNISTSTIHVTPVNDAPVVTFGAITGFTEPPNGTPAANSTPVTIAPNLTISDVDSTNLTSATFVLNNLKPLDALSVSGHAGPSGDIGNIHFEIVTAIGGPSNSETVTFTGTDTIAHYNAVLDLVQFNNTSENPDTTARSYTVTAVDDGGGDTILPSQSRDFRPFGRRYRRRQPQRHRDDFHGPCRADLRHHRPLQLHQQRHPHRPAHRHRGAGQHRAVDPGLQQRRRLHRF